jgi:hypothetical protein
MSRKKVSRALFICQPIKLKVAACVIILARRCHPSSLLSLAQHVAAHVTELNFPGTCACMLPARHPSLYFLPCEPINPSFLQAAATGVRSARRRPSLLPPSLPPPRNVSRWGRTAHDASSRLHRPPQELVCLCVTYYHY